MPRRARPAALFDGPEPEHSGRLVDALPDLPPATPEEPSAPKAPFEAQGPRATNMGAAPAAPGERATQGSVDTAPVPDLPAEVWQMMGRMPFRPASPRVEATTLEVPVLVRDRGQTAPIGDDALAKAGAALPFAGTSAGAAIVPFPPLKLQEYASLHAELAVWPEREGEILLALPRAERGGAPGAGGALGGAACRQ